MRVRLLALSFSAPLTYTSRAHYTHIDYVIPIFKYITLSL